MLFLKIIILCVWCNRICWHNLKCSKNIIFQILYIIVGPLCPASLKRLVCNIYKLPKNMQTLYRTYFLQSPSFQQAQSALIGQLTQCIHKMRCCSVVSNLNYS